MSLINHINNVKNQDFQGKINKYKYNLKIREIKGITKILKLNWKYQQKLMVFENNSK